MKKHLQNWLRIPPSFTSLWPYIRSGQLQLRLSSIIEEYMIAMCSVEMMYRDFSDENVRGAGVTTRSGCKWAADSRLKLKDIIGKLGTRRHPLPAIGESRPKAEERHDTS